MYAIIQKLYSKKSRGSEGSRFCIHALLYFTLCTAALQGQIAPGVYKAKERIAEGVLEHEIKVTDTYLVYTVYNANPPAFIKTIGGFFKMDGGNLELEMEFNSQFDTDGLKALHLPVKVEKNSFIWGKEGTLKFTAVEPRKQPLDGLWLFATRGPDTGQERRGEDNTRKTMKFLRDGHFQWIAYDTEDMRFSGTGGGGYQAMEGTYTEHIEYFSRDSSRVGATLEFEYDLQGNDWHHTGTNSRGEPLYEIWSRRSGN
jgi:hypothetical protein